MAYMDQETKKALAPGIKKAIPKGWSTTLAIKNNSKLVLNIWAAPVNLIDKARRVSGSEHIKGYLQLNTYHLNTTFDGELLEVFKGIVAAMNAKNHDNSDLQSDYFDVGYYIGINIGTYDMPFTYVL